MKRERERGRKRQTDRQTDRERQTDRDKESDRQRELGLVVQVFCFGKNNARLSFSQVVKSRQRTVVAFLLLLLLHLKSSQVFLSATAAVWLPFRINTVLIVNSSFVVDFYSAVTEYASESSRHAFSSTVNPCRFKQQTIRGRWENRRRG